MGITDSKITVVAASDNHYAVMLAVLITSMEKNHRTSEKIDFYLIDDGISAENKQRIVDSSNPEKSFLTWVKTKEAVPPHVVIPTDRSAYPITTYLRLFAPHIVSPDVQKIIYIDADMLVLEDISRLWEVDLQGKLFAAATDIAKVVSCAWSGVPNYKELGMSPDTPYFNAGIMLIDAVKWREADISNQVIECIHNNLKHVNYADQYGLNVILADQWLELDPRWNSPSVQDLPDPWVIHFIDVKPIYQSYRGNQSYRDQFYEYLELTQWGDFKPISTIDRLVRKVLIKIKKLPRRLFPGQRATTVQLN